VRELRLRKLQETVLRDGLVEVDSIAQALEVSRETIRRDLTALASKGLVRRTRGGATAPGGSLTELDLSVRSTEHHAAKVAIARYVAQHLVDDGTSVALDTGTTTLEVARALRGRKITVVTPSLPVISELAGTDTTVLVVGLCLYCGEGYPGVIGRLWPLLGSFNPAVVMSAPVTAVGPVAERTVRQFQCDLAFISAPAITADVGLMDTDLDGVAVKQSLLEHAARAYAVLDHTKLGRTAFVAVCGVGALTGIVTDDGADPADLTDFREIGLEVHQATG